MNPNTLIWTYEADTFIAGEVFIGSNLDSLVGKLVHMV